MAHQKRLNVYVYGSCVARDTAAAIGPEAATIIGYTARHSILSEGTDASYKLPDDLGLTSAFQTRMVRQDWAGNPLNQLFAQADTIDLLLWDLMDERIGVHWFLTGEIITRSVDLMRSEPALDLLEPNTRIPFGTDTHYDGWAEKTTEFVHKLKETGLLPKTRLIKIDWAETIPDGTKTPYSMGLSPAKANKLYTRYYQHLQTLGVPTIEVPTGITTADPNHQWGLAPFHYTADVYQYIINHLDTPTIQGQTQPTHTTPQPKPAHYTTTLPQLEPLTTTELTTIGTLLTNSTQTYFTDALYQTLITSWNITHPGQNLDNLTPESLWLTHTIATELNHIPWRNIFFFRGQLPVFELTWNTKVLAIDITIEPNRDAYHLNIRAFLRNGNLTQEAAHHLSTEFTTLYTQTNPTELILTTQTPTLETAHHETLTFIQQLHTHLTTPHPIQ